MKKRFDKLELDHQNFIEAQHIYYVTAAASEGRVNMALMGQDSLRVTGPNRIFWLNLTGSENETAAHLSCAADHIPLSGQGPLGATVCAMTSAEEKPLGWLFEVGLQRPAIFIG